MTERKITVRFTVAQWNALHSCATGELESLEKADVESGLFDALDSAVDAMEKARKTAAKREP